MLEANGPSPVRRTGILISVRHSYDHELVKVHLVAAIITLRQRIGQGQQPKGVRLRGESWLRDLVCILANIKRVLVLVH